MAVALVCIPVRHPARWSASRQPAASQPSQTCAYVRWMSCCTCAQPAAPCSNGGGVRDALRHCSWKLGATNRSVASMLLHFCDRCGLLLQLFFSRRRHSRERCLWLVTDASIVPGHLTGDKGQRGLTRLSRPQRQSKRRLYVTWMDERSGWG
jgi:hypothetical protein